MRDFKDSITSQLLIFLKVIFKEMQWNCNCTNRWSLFGAAAIRAYEDRVQPTTTMSTMVIQLVWVSTMVGFHNPMWCFQRLDAHISALLFWLLIAKTGPNISGSVFYNMNSRLIPFEKAYCQIKFWYQSSEIENSMTNMILNKNLPSLCTKDLQFTS